MSFLFSSPGCIQRIMNLFMQLFKPNLTMKNVLLLSGILFISFLSNAQKKNCDCGKDMEFLTYSYLNDYSGIQDFAKLNPDYIKVIDNIKNQAKSTNNIQKCDKIIGKLIHYINNGHVYYGQTEKNPYYKKNKTDAENLSESSEPELYFLDSITVLFSLKSCELSYKSILDSLILVNKAKLDRTEHFIIDLRGNGGGGDPFFTSLISYLYTNPILVYTAELWASENNIKNFENLLYEPEIPDSNKKMIQLIIDRAKKHPNQFVPFSENTIDTIVLEEITEYPKKVSIVIDNKCASSTEQFLLLAKQSTKTTIYGYTNTMGVLDYANLNFIITPSGYWYASVPMTRSARLPDNPVDPDGIKPDIYVDKKIKDIILWLRHNYE